MKKLMFAAAIAASAAAFADPINSIGFAGYANGATFTNGATEKDESSIDKAATYGYFCFYGDSDSSVVTNDNPSTTKHTPAFATAKDAKYLALDTEGGTLWRSINTLSYYPIGENDAVYSNGTARAVAATGTYLDTLVQFTVTEDEAPTLGEDDKLAIWLQADNGTTNLMVKAAVVDDQSGRTETTFTVTGTTVDPGIWYRLTVKAIADITDGDGIPGFQIFLDGNLVTADKPTLTTAYLALIDTDSHYADLVAGKYFASLKTVTTLQGVGFQGTGAVDEIVWTDDDLFPAGPTGIEFTLTWGEGVSAVSYTFGDFSTTNTMTSGTAVQLPVGDGTAQIELIPTFTSGYVFDKVTMGETDLTLTFAIPSVSTNATLLAKADWVKDPTKDITPGDTAATAYPGLAGSALATADAQKLTTWAKAKNIAYNDIKNDTTGTYTEAYLLNCAVADVEDEKAAFKAYITVAADGTPTVTATTTNTDGDAYNGTPQMKGSNDLDTWTDVEGASTSYHFYKYVLSL